MDVITASSKCGKYWEKDAGEFEENLIKGKAEQPFIKSQLFSSREQD